MITFALLTFILSALGVYTSRLVETWFSRRIYTYISRAFGVVADAAPFAWLDVLLTLALLFTIACIARRVWNTLAAGVAVAYLIFFWSWGLNYHRIPLTEKFSVNLKEASPAAIEGFVHEAAGQLNALYGPAAKDPSSEAEIRDQCVLRIRRVVERLDGTDWNAASRMKTSIFADPWFRAADIEGVFDPIIHEPVVNSSLLDVERPFVFAHELAHVRGYPDEGDANFIALLATLVADNDRLRYSGWLNLWFYLGSPEADRLLDPGPRRDLQRIDDRVRQGRIAWISNVQAVVLDWFLKANTVQEGIRSYSRIVLLAVATRPEWQRFR